MESRRLLSQDGRKNLYLKGQFQVHGPVFSRDSLKTTSDLPCNCEENSEQLSKRVMDSKEMFGTADYLQRLLN